jgi:hypothetical protein
VGGRLEDRTGDVERNVACDRLAVLGVDQPEGGQRVEGGRLAQRGVLRAVDEQLDGRVAAMVLGGALDRLTVTVPPLIETSVTRTPVGQALAYCGSWALSGRSISVTAVPILVTVEVSRIGRWWNSRYSRWRPWSSPT